MTDSLRDRITRALHATFPGDYHEDPKYGCAPCDVRAAAVMDAIQPEIDALTRTADRCRKADQRALAALTMRAEDAERERNAFELRAKQAETAIAKHRAYLDENFRFWCSPHGVASDYANKLIDHLDAAFITQRPEPPSPLPEGDWRDLAERALKEREAETERADTFEVRAKMAEAALKAATKALRTAQCQVGCGDTDAAWKTLGDWHRSHGGDGDTDCDHCARTLQGHA